MSHNLKKDLPPNPNVDRTSWPDCLTCRDKGYTEYKPLDGFAHFHWVPYKKRKCTCDKGIAWGKENRDG